MYCHNVAGLLYAMGCVHDPTEWHLFIDSSKASLTLSRSGFFLLSMSEGGGGVDSTRHFGS